MDDIVQRLMTQARVGLMGVPDDFDVVSYRQAADTITALRAERDAYRDTIINAWNALGSGIVVTEADLPHIEYMAHGTLDEQISELVARGDAAYRKGAEDMRERAAAWHEAKVAEYTDQIAANDAYLARSGRHSSESRANEYCDDRRSGHRRYAAAIRKLEATP